MQPRMPPPVAQALARPAGAEMAVDVALVLALDASGSLSDAGFTLQREGYARAVASAAFVAAVRSGWCGSVALTVVEWSSQDRQDQTVPWSLVEDRASAGRFAAALLRAPRPVPGFTSISGAIDFAVGLLARAPFRAAQRVIDISGNGTNNDGRPVAEARDAAVAEGCIVNGLPILDAVDDLDGYFSREVIGGRRAFMVVAEDFSSIAAAILRKLLVEVALAPGAGAGRG